MQDSSSLLYFLWQKKLFSWGSKWKFKINLYFLLSFYGLIMGKNERNQTSTWRALSGWSGRRKVLAKIRFQHFVDTQMAEVQSLFLLSFICKENIQSFLPPSTLHSHFHILKHCSFQTKVLSQAGQAPGRFREMTERDTRLPVIC